MQSSLFDKVASDLQLFKKDTPTKVSHGYCEIFINSFFYGKPLVAVSDSPATVQSTFVPSRALEFH